MAADTPFYPSDYVARMLAAVDQQHPLACACYQGRTQPVFGLWPIQLHNELHYALSEEGIHKVDVFSARYGVAHVDFDDRLYNPFFNVNLLAHVAEAEALLVAHVAPAASMVT
jgi:molybdopterin-guanine dinucleotide biosynthesis protein A